MCIAPLVLDEYHQSIHLSVFLFVSLAIYLIFYLSLYLGVSYVSGVQRKLKNRKQGDYSRRGNQLIRFKQNIYWGYITHTLHSELIYLVNQCKTAHTVHSLHVYISLGNPLLNQAKFYCKYLGSRDGSSPLFWKTK